MGKICYTCGTLYPLAYPSKDCLICNEERQYVPQGGQVWVTQEELAARHKNKIIKLNDRLFEIVITPGFAIGQRAFLVLSESGNVLWDCIPLLCEETIRFITSKGGLDAIAFSHPHYYSNMSDWATTFDCPVYIHEDDAEFIVYKSDYIHLWQGEELSLCDDLKLVNIGGHFKGSSILHISDMSVKGTILSGDTVYLSLSKKHYAIMYSYPNRIPLPISEIKRIKKRFESLEFDSIYGFFSYQNVIGTARELLETSLNRYLD